MKTPLRNWFECQVENFAKIHLTFPPDYTTSIFLCEPIGKRTLIYQSNELPATEQARVAAIAKECHSGDRPLTKRKPTPATATIIPSKKRTSLIFTQVARRERPRYRIKQRDLLEAVSSQGELLLKLIDKLLQKQAKEISENLIEDSPNPIIAVNRYGTVLTFSPAAEKFFEHESRQIIGTCVTKLYESPKEAKKVGQELHDNPGNTLKNREFKIKTSRGTAKPIILSARQYYEGRGSSRRKIGSISIFQDAELIEALYKERARKKYFHDLILDSPDPTVVINKDGSIEIINNAACSMFEYTSRQITGRSIENLYTDPSEARRVGGLLRCSPEHRVENLEAQTITKSGRVISVSLSARWLRDEDGVFSGSVGVFKNLLEIKNKIIARLAQTTGHRTKNSLQQALMNLYALEQSTDKENAKGAIADLKCNLMEAVDGIKNLLTASRPDAPAMKWVSAGSIAREIARRFESQAFLQGITFRVRTAGEYLKVPANFQQIMEVFSNLFSNSSDAILEKAAHLSSRLNAREEYTGEIEVLVACSIGALSIEWSDNGSGIQNHHQTKIFDESFTNKADNSGNGLGLFLSKRIIEEHRGSIRVESEEGRFKRFFVSIPRDATSIPSGVEKSEKKSAIAKAPNLVEIEVLEMQHANRSTFESLGLAVEAPAIDWHASRRVPKDFRSSRIRWPAIEERGIAAAKPKSHVFVVDDMPGVGAAISNALRTHVQNVEYFISGEEFLRQEIPSEPSCLILDLRMRGGMGGLEVQSALAARGDTTPIIFLSAYEDFSEAKRAVKTGAIDFLRKPVAPDRLVDLVLAALERDRKTKDLQERAESLSNREREVLELVVQGLPNKQIASRLGIRLGTVKAHRHNVMRKMRADSLPELTLMAKRMNLGPNSLDIPELR